MTGVKKELTTLSSYQLFWAFRFILNWPIVPGLDLLWAHYPVVCGGHQSG